MVTILGVEVSKKDAAFAGFSGYMAFSGNLLENGRKMQGGYFFYRDCSLFFKASQWRILEFPKIKIPPQPQKTRIPYRDPPSMTARAKF